MYFKKLKTSSIFNYMSNFKLRLNFNIYQIILAINLLLCLEEILNNMKTRIDYS